MPLFLLSGAGGGGGIPDAPSDGKIYGRKNAAWSEVIASAGGAALDYVDIDYLNDYTDLDTLFNTTLGLDPDGTFTVLANLRFNAGSQPAPKSGAMLYISRTAFESYTVTAVDNDGTTWYGRVNNRETTWTTSSGGGSGDLQTVLDAGNTADGQVISLTADVQASPGTARFMSETTGNDGSATHHSLGNFYGSTLMLNSEFSGPTADGDWTSSVGVHADDNAAGIILSSGRANASNPADDGNNVFVLAVSPIAIGITISTERIAVTHNGTSSVLAYLGDLDAMLAAANAYTDQEIASAVTGDAQTWLPAVDTVANLPVVTDTSKTYLCRVTDDNDVYQCIAGQSAWLLYSSNTDYVDELELEAVTGDLSALTTTDKSTLVAAINEVNANAGVPDLTSIENYDASVPQVLSHNSSGVLRWV